MSEVELASHVTRWFRESGWDVYEEVSFGYGSALDIVAVRAPVVAAIEAKLSLSLAVLGQAKRWVNKAHLTYVATPSHARGSARDGAVWICKTLGIGLLGVSKQGSVNEIVHPQFRRVVDSKFITSKLCSKQQDGSIPAGSAAGPRWTPWRMTVTSLTEYVTQNPGVTLAEALKHATHHYSSDKAARASLSHQIRKGILKTVRLEDGKLYATGTRAP